MVRQDIFAGLRAALEKGEQLNQAMISFYNAGYKKEEIEEAARALQAGQPVLMQPQVQPQVQQPGQLPQQPGQPQPIQPQMQHGMPMPMYPQVQLQPGQTPQFVSGYGKQKKPGKGLIIVLVVVLLLLIGILTTIFLFKDAIMGFFQ